MTTVLDRLREAARSSARLYYRSDDGNAGDALINMGFYSLAEREGLPYRELEGRPMALTGLGPQDLVVMSGGGSLSSHWNIGERSLRALTQFDVPLLLLPQSVDAGSEPVLRLLREQDTLFVRENYSLKLVRDMNLACRVEIDHDVAFGADLDLIRRTSLWRRPRHPDDLRRAAAFARHRLLATRGLPLRSWRNDAERAEHGPGGGVTTRRDDLSQLANFGTLDHEANCYSARWLIEVISWYSRVETDRLHVGVAAALLGKPVVLHSNDYHKIKGIYEYSIRDDPRYGPLVTFAGAAGS